MRINQLQSAYLYEGLDQTTTNSMLLWETTGLKLKESALTSDQIQQIFQDAEQGSTTSGSNRTVLGKGKDAAEAVNKAWEDLKTKVQNSGPIQSVDQKYDDAVAKIERGLGGPDNAVNKIIQKYRTFAKQHPIAQSFVYGALIAAAGLSGAGLGGAAVLGLLKMADKLLQGEKFSSAAYSGAKTGAMAYGASKIADLFKSNAPAADAVTTGLGKGLNNQQIEYLTNLGKQGATAIVKDNSVWVQLQDGTMQMLTAPRGVAPQAMLKIINSAAGTESIVWTGKKLSEGQIYMIFNRIVREDIMEGPLDAIKGAAGKAAGWLKTKGHNLTTKITVDKLNSAWQKAGSPMDSDDVFNILLQAGVSDNVINNIYDNLKLPKPSTTKNLPDFKELEKQILTLNTKDRQRLINDIKTELGMS